MLFSLFFNNSFFFTFSTLIIGFYLLLTLCFAIRFGTSNELALPNILPSVTASSCFFLLPLIYFFCTSLNVQDLNSFYFFNQHTQLFFLVLAFFVSIISRDFLKFKLVSTFEYDFLFLFVIFSSLCLCFSDDFLIIYLAIELQSLAFYVFASFLRNSEFSTEAGLKYFLFGAVVSCFLLLGFVIVYLGYGFTAFELVFSICSTQDEKHFLFLGAFFVMFALLFKIGAAPFHFWLLDVYEGAFISATLLFAALPKMIILNLMVKIFLFSFYNLQAIWSPFFLVAGLASIAFGSVAALFQKRVKRLFAYSTIAHTGFILFGVLLATPSSVQALTFYVVVYFLLTVLLFSLLIYATNVSKIFPKYVLNWVATGPSNWLFIFTFSVVLFSIAGVPPLAGFFSKFFVLMSIISEKYFFTAIVIIILSSVACFYYIRLIKMFFFSPSAKNKLWISSPSRQSAEITIAFLVIFNLFFFLFPDFLCKISVSLGLVLL